MKKFHWLSSKGWLGPLHFHEILSKKLDSKTLIWYPELCEGGMSIPDDCYHDPVTFEEIHNTMKKKICRYIIFTKTPLKGCFRYKDEFQIFPASFDKVPQNKYATHFPVVLEFWVDLTKLHTIPDELSWLEEKWALSEMTSVVNKVRYITSLLTAFTNHRFFTYSDNGGSWVIPISDDILPEEQNNIPSEWAHKIFYYPGIHQDVAITAFTNVNYPQIPKKQNQILYYLIDPLDNHKGEILLPPTITEIFDAYFDLDQKVQNIADSSAYLICNGVDLLNEMKSLSFLSFVSSIETIANQYYTDKNKKVEIECQDCKSIKSSPFSCQRCGQPIWGIAAKFREFLSEYIANGEGPISKYKKIYNLRSKIVHSGSLLLNDKQIDWNQIDGKNDHWMTLRDTMQFSRIALINWILEEAKKKSKISN